MPSPFAMSLSSVPGWVQCPDCKGWYDPSEYRSVKVWDGLDERTICRNCAHLMDWQGCYCCGETVGCAQCGDEYLCCECGEAEGWQVCDGCNEGFGEDELADCNGDQLCEDCRDRQGYYQCNACEEWLHRDDLFGGCDDNDYCSNCWSDRFSTCEGCNETFWSEDLNYRDDGCYCSDCAPSMNEFDPRGFVGCDDYSRMPSRRKFGIELETDECDNSYDLEGSDAWGAKHDGSIHGLEFYSDILYGDAGLEAVDDICRFAGRHGWSVDRSCGYHAHFDMREENDDSLKAIACAYLLTYDVWSKFVDSRRLSNSFCSRSGGSISDIHSTPRFSDYASNQHRYEWINFQAYRRHTTFEIRLHEGTLDAETVCNWIRAHATFMDWASEVGWAQVRNTLLCMTLAEKFEFIAQIWARAGCEDLGEYYGSKAGLLCEVCA